METPAYHMKAFAFLGILVAHAIVALSAATALPMLAQTDKGKGKVTPAHKTSALSREKIAFMVASTAEEVNFDIYMMNADGSHRTRLIKDGQSPCFSPDGKRILFLSYCDDNVELYSMNTDGSHATRLTYNRDDDESPRFSSDGKKITWSRGDLNKRVRADIYVMNADGSSPSRLTNNGYDNQSPCFSPDGRKIAFSSKRRTLRPDIYVMKSDGSSEIRLTDIPSVTPCFSPDGKKIAFSAYRDGHWEIFAMNADGSEITQLTRDCAVAKHPTFSPDGTKIAWISENNGAAQIYVMNISGTNKTRLAQNVFSAQLSWARGSAPPRARASRKQKPNK